MKYFEQLHVERVKKHKSKRDISNLIFKCLKIKYDTQTISRWESGRTDFSVDVLILLSDYYDISLDTLMNDAINPEFGNEEPYSKIEQVVSEYLEVPDLTGLLQKYQIINNEYVGTTT